MVASDKLLEALDKEPPRPRLVSVPSPLLVVLVKLALLLVVALDKRRLLVVDSDQLEDLEVRCFDDLKSQTRT